MRADPCRTFKLKEEREGGREGGRERGKKGGRGNVPPSHLLGRRGRKPTHVYIQRKGGREGGRKGGREGRRTTEPSSW